MGVYQEARNVLEMIRDTELANKTPETSAIPVLVNTIFI
jgi:hypothetical protein